jgi:hypothetical protein
LKAVVRHGDASRWHKAAAILLTVVANLRSLKVARRHPFPNVRFWLRLSKKSLVRLGAV